MPRIVLVGLKPNQCRLVEKSVRAKFVAIGSKEHGRRIPNADLFVVWTRFVSHTICNSLYAQHGKDRVVWHENGVGSLIEMLSRHPLVCQTSQSI